MADEPRLAVESIAGLRPYQEDSVLTETLSDGRILIAVADGMGGHAAGEVASALALESLVAALEDGLDLDTAFTHANEQVHRKAEEPGKQGMGTTLVAALVEDGEYFIANVGDSRGYLVAGDGIRQLTEDHSFVAEAVKRGQSLEEAMATPWRDALTRSIGTEPQVEVDVFGPFPVKADTALLICSDGLYKTLSDEDLQRIYLQSSSPRGSAQTLVNEALESGSDDNITVAIAEYGEVPRAAQGTMPMSFVVPSQEGPGEAIEPVPAEPIADAVSSLADTVPNEAVPETPPSDMVEGSASAPASSGPPMALIVAAVVILGVVLAFFVL